MAINKNGQWIQSGFNERLLPSGYTQLEYLESTGTQYIDTGVIGQTGLSSQIKCNLSEIPNDGCLLGSRTGGNRIYLFYIYPSKWNLGFGDNYNTNITPIVNTDYILNSELYNGSQIFKINNTVSYTNTIAKNINSSANLYLFCNNYNTASYFVKMKLYYCKIWQNDKLVRDFIPALRNNDNVAGLYDRVNNIFYTNAGTGSFTTGPKVGGMTANVKIYKETNALEANDFWEI